MKYLEEFRDPYIAKALAAKIAENAEGLPDIKLMEVCGSHTMAIAKYGIRKLLPKNIKLISGPGCPVCVTANVYLDKSIAISRLPDVIISTFGDMMRVPGSTSSLEKERSRSDAAGKNLCWYRSTGCLFGLSLPAVSPGISTDQRGAGLDFSAYPPARSKKRV